MSGDTMGAPVKLEPADWQGNAGERWANNVDHYETMLSIVGETLLDRAGFAAGETVVEIGCGGGGLTRQIAGAVAPTGKVTGLDISPVLIALARERAHAGGVANAEFIAGDAQVDTPEAAPFDRLVSRFGVMFFAEPPAAMRNLHSMLKPGGRLDFAVWAPMELNPWASTMMQAARTHLNMDPPQPGGPGPFAFSDVDYLRGLLEDAGFGAVAIETWSGKVTVGKPGDGAAEIADTSISTGSLTEVLKKADDRLHEKVRTELIGLLEPYITPLGAQFPASVHMVKATAFAEAVPSFAPQHSHIDKGPEACAS